jgi:hypothetical protein
MIEASMFGFRITSAHLGIMGALLLASACGSKEHPAALMDDEPLPKDASASHPKTDAHADGFTIADLDGSISDASGPGSDGGGLQVDPLADWLKHHCAKPPYEAMLCYYPDDKHPSAAAVARNMDTRNAVYFEWAIDAAHRVFKTRAAYMGKVWTVTVTGPEGKELAPGSYSTESGDGTAFDFTWDTGACPAKESATFDIFNVGWDAMDIPTKVEIDFKHHCGELTDPMAEGVYRLHSSLPP